MIENSFMNEILDTYYVDTHYLLEEIERLILYIENQPVIDSQIDELFCYMHTLKGRSYMFGIEDIGIYAHVLENILSDLKDKEILLSENLINLLIEGHDFIKTLLVRGENRKYDNYYEHLISGKSIMTRIKESLGADISIYENYLLKENFIRP